MSINLGPGPSTTLFAVPAGSWSSLNRRVALLTSGWAPDYAAQFNPINVTSGVAPAAYDFATYVADSQQWCSTYFPMLAGIALQTQRFVQELGQLVADLTALSTAQFASRYSAISDAVQITQQEVLGFFNFFVPYLESNTLADQVLSLTAAQDNAAYFPPLTGFFVPLGGLSLQFTTALAQFNAGWITLQTQFAAGATLIQRAGATSVSQLAADLDLTAANYLWQAELPSVTGFIALAVRQQTTELTGDYVYELFPPCPGLTIGDSYYLGFSNAWLQAGLVPPHEITLLSYTVAQLAPADAQSWSFAAIPGSCGCYYLVGSLLGEGQVLTCEVNSLGTPSFYMVPQAAVPANGWRFYNFGAPGTTSYALSNAAQGVTINLCAIGSSLGLNRPIALATLPPGSDLPDTLVMPGPDPLIVGNGMLQHIATSAPAGAVAT